MNIYLDIDGVLLTRKQGIPENIDVFIDFVTTNFECYWLTTHCRTGVNKALHYLSKYYPANLLDKLKDVKPTDWMDKKTEGIDFENSFIWLDDNPFEAERNDLIKHGKLESLLVVDLELNNELLEIIKELKAAYSNVTN